jgi:hypothetical protein
MTKYDRQLRHKKGEKLTNLNTYAFTTDQVPHVFGRLLFCRTYAQIHERIHQKALLNIDLCKGINRKGPSNQSIWAKYRSRSSLGPL